MFVQCTIQVGENEATKTMQGIDGWRVKEV
jgi:hypothetical protein